MTILISLLLILGALWVCKWSGAPRQPSPWCFILYVYTNWRACFLFHLQQNKYLLLPWVVLGLMLVIGLVISIIYTAIRFYIWGDNYTATMYLVLGLIGNGKHKLFNRTNFFMVLDINIYMTTILMNNSNIVIIDGLIWQLLILIYSQVKNNNVAVYGFQISIKASGITFPHMICLLVLRSLANVLLLESKIVSSEA